MYVSSKNTFWNSILFSRPKYATRTKTYISLPFHLNDLNPWKRKAQSLVLQFRVVLRRGNMCAAKWSRFYRHFPNNLTLFKFMQNTNATEIIANEENKSDLGSNLIGWFPKFFYWGEDTGCRHSSKITPVSPFFFLKRNTRSNNESWFSSTHRTQALRPLQL